MTFIKCCADIVLCQCGNDFIVYQEDREFFISKNKQNAEKEFNKLVNFSENLANSF